MPEEIKFAIAQPKYFTKKAIVVINAYSILALVPFLIIPLFFVVIDLILCDFRLAYPVIELVLSLADLGLIIFLLLYFLPIEAGNPHVRKLVHRLSLPDRAGYIMQIAKIPRLKSGFWAFMEDADDIGLLLLGENGLIFKGDSIDFSFPYELIKTIRKRNIGWRGLWIHGIRIRIDISDPSGEKSFEFCELSSLTIPASRRITKELFNLLSAKIQK